MTTPNCPLCQRQLSCASQRFFLFLDWRSITSSCKTSWPVEVDDSLELSALVSPTKFLAPSFSVYKPTPTFWGAALQTWHFDASQCWNLVFQHCDESTLNFFSPRSKIQDEAFRRRIPFNSHSGSCSSSACSWGKEEEGWEWVVQRLVNQRVLRGYTTYPNSSGCEGCCWGRT